MAEDSVTLREHLEALRKADALFQAERDRRYAEVSVEREKALKIKEIADLAALELARQIQTYKDEKANELREQINSERGLYATKDDLGNAVREIRTLMAPLSEYVSSQQGRSSGFNSGWTYIVSAAVLLSAVIAIIVKL
jgi:hypothetical protein